MGSIDSGQAPKLSLTSSVVEFASLSASQRARLYELISGHFENIDEARFFHDLREKAGIILVTDVASGAICGFSSVTRIDTTLDGAPLSAVYAGDTVLEPNSWGYSGWVRAWTQQAFALTDAAPTQPVYLVLLTSTHRTYRFIPTFFYESYPRPGHTIPPDFKARRDAVARLKFPDEYDADRGIVRLRQPTPVRANRLDLAALDRPEENERTRFFHQANPGHAQGDYLACIAAFTRENFTPLGRRATGLGRMFH